MRRLREVSPLPDKEVHICTVEDPWTPEKSRKAGHPMAECIYDGGLEQEYEIYKCPICGHVFKVTIPG
jgi:hypothetical protein